MGEEIKSVLVPLSRGGTERLLATGYFCPSCGVGGKVWEEDAEGDVYCGPDHICASCGALFTLNISAVGKPKTAAHTSTCDVHHADRLAALAAAEG